ncbi:MAG: hypothetical protein ACK4KV_00385 [Rhodocyclaceae bacterium]
MKTLASEFPAGIGGASFVISSLVLGSFLWLLSKPASSVSKDAVGLSVQNAFVQDKSGSQLGGEPNVEIKLLLHRLDRLPAAPIPLDVPAPASPV